MRKLMNFRLPVDVVRVIREQPNQTNFVCEAVRLCQAVKTTQAMPTLQKNSLALQSETEQDGARVQEKHADHAEKQGVGGNVAGHSHDFAVVGGFPNGQGNIWVVQQCNCGLLLSHIINTNDPALGQSEVLKHVT